jgi:SAM-dependent methyltransferase
MLRTETGFTAALHRLAAYQYLAPWLSGQSVLEIGCGSGDGLRMLWAVGAQRVTGLDRDVRAARDRLSGLGEMVTVRAVRPPRLGVRRERFSRVIISDARWLVRYPGLLLQARGALAPGGELLLRAESGDHPAAGEALDYGELMDLVEPEFERVRVLGQSPFIGYSVVELGGAPEDELEITLDAALMGNDVEDVETYLMLCAEAREPAAPFPYGILQVPTAGDDALEQWWDAQGEPPEDTEADEEEREPEEEEEEEEEEEPEPEPEPEPGPEPEPEQEEREQAAAEAEDRERAEQKDGEQQQAAKTGGRAPSESGDPRPPTDGTADASPAAKPAVRLEAFTDEAGGRPARWRWPRFG